MRNTFNREHILNLCEPVDCGLLSPPMKAQTAVDELCRYFLGKDWYSTSGATHPEQINTEIVVEIERRFKGAKLHKKVTWE